MTTTRATWRTPPRAISGTPAPAAGLTYRSYGEYGRRVSQPDGTFKMDGAVPGPGRPHVPRFRHSPSRGGGRSRDTDNADVFLKEFAEFEKTGNLPRFIVMSLGEDHTTGTRPGTFTPQACVASNDLALGRLVEAVSAQQVLAARRPSSSSRTTPRTAPTTSTPTAPSAW